MGAAVRPEAPFSDGHALWGSRPLALARARAPANFVSPRASLSARARVHPSWCDPRSALTESVHACKDAPIINAIVISKDEVRPRAQGCAYLPSAPWTISCSLSTRARVRLVRNGVRRPHAEPVPARKGAPTRLNCVQVRPCARGCS